MPCILNEVSEPTTISLFASASFDVAWLL